MELALITAENNLIDYEQHTILYPLYEKRKNGFISDLYQMKKVNSTPLYSIVKDLDLKCFPFLYPEGKYGQFHPRSQKLISSEYVKARLMSKHSQFRLDQQYLFFFTPRCKYTAIKFWHILQNEYSKSKAKNIC